jgi:hypothetical protein
LRVYGNSSPTPAAAVLLPSYILDFTRSSIAKYALLSPTILVFGRLNVLYVSHYVPIAVQMAKVVTLKYR